MRFGISIDYWISLSSTRHPRQRKDRRVPWASTSTPSNGRCTTKNTFYDRPRPPIPSDCTSSATRPRRRRLLHPVSERPRSQHCLPSSRKACSPRPPSLHGSCIPFALSGLLLSSHHVHSTGSSVFPSEWRQLALANSLHHYGLRLAQVSPAEATLCQRSEGGALWAATTSQEAAAERWLPGACQISASRPPGQGRQTRA